MRLSSTTMFRAQRQSVVLVRVTDDEGDLATDYGEPEARTERYTCEALVYPLTGVERVEQPEGTYPESRVRFWLPAGSPVSAIPGDEIVWGDQAFLVILVADWGSYVIADGLVQTPPAPDWAE